MIFKIIFSFAASIIKFVILCLLITKSVSDDSVKKFYSKDAGILSIMYHRFEENKYPSTNIQFDIFKEHIQIIKNNNFQFLHPNDLSKEFDKHKKQKKILLTIDDAFSSFYNNAWPFIKKNEIPFILFVSTEPVGKNGYMSWDQIKEVEKEEFAFIGNHSHSHGYLLELTEDEFKKDINKSIKLFNENLGYNPIFFSYPFGEYSFNQKSFIKEKFDFAFGQNSGVIDLNKDKFELPRFPINEKYGDLERFEFLIKLRPLEYKNINIRDNFIKNSENPPDLTIEFFDDQKYISNINCYSDEGDGWHQTNIEIIQQKLKVNFSEKFNFRRGRINCSLNYDNHWKWLGLQFSVDTD